MPMPGKAVIQLIEHILRAFDTRDFGQFERCLVLYDQAGDDAQGANGGFRGLEDLRILLPTALQEFASRGHQLEPNHITGHAAKTCAGTVAGVGNGAAKRWIVHVQQIRHRLPQRMQHRPQIVYPRAGQHLGLELLWIMRHDAT
ncbi:hypothetical protein FQZ97_635770 [compost metagenome]